MIRRFVLQYLWKLHNYHEFKPKTNIKIAIFLGKFGDWVLPYTAWLPYLIALSSDLSSRLQSMVGAHTRFFCKNPNWKFVVFGWEFPYATRWNNSHYKVRYFILLIQTQVKQVILNEQQRNLHHHIQKLILHNIL